MIQSLEEAKLHANHNKLTSYKNVIVFSDGSIHAGNDKDALQKIVSSDCFIVKGDLEKPTAKPKKENKETKEEQ